MRTRPRCSIAHAPSCSLYEARCTLQHHDAHVAVARALDQAEHIVGARHSSAGCAARAPEAALRRRAGSGLRCAGVFAAQAEPLLAQKNLISSSFNADAAAACSCVMVESILGVDQVERGLRRAFPSQAVPESPLQLARPTLHVEVLRRPGWRWRGAQPAPAHSKRARTRDGANEAESAESGHESASRS